MDTALKNMWESVAIDAGAVLDRDRSGAGDLTLETSGLRPADRSQPSDLTLGVHRYYPFVVEDRGRLGKSALTVVYIFAVLLAVRNFPGGPSAPTSCFLRGQSVQALRNFVASQIAESRRHLLRTRRGLLQRVSACVHGTLGGILSAGVQMAKSDAWARAHSASSHVTASTSQSL
eukprot:jgi/Tetstr1/436981/TSEL_025753.t1